MSKTRRTKGEYVRVDRVLLPAVFVQRDNSTMWQMAPTVETNRRVSHGFNACAKRVSCAPFYYTEGKTLNKQNSSDVEDAA